MDKLKPYGIGLDIGTNSVYVRYTKDGIKSCAGQDTFHFFGFEVENSNIRFMGVYDGHGNNGREASDFVNKSIQKLITDIFQLIISNSSSF